MRAFCVMAVRPPRRVRIRPSIRYSRRLTCATANKVYADEFARLPQMDVFTAVPFKANPVAVILDDLSGEQLQYRDHSAFELSTILRKPSCQSSCRAKSH